MRKLLIISLLILVVLPALAQDTRFNAPPLAYDPRDTAAPTIDGIIEPGEWARAVPLSPFVLVGGQGQPQYRTSLSVMYDNHCLYIAAALNDPNPAGLKADATQRDGQVWMDDDLELFFDTDDQRKSYIHLAVNSKEVQYDALMKDAAADFRWKARTATTADGWTVEFELPFANDFPPAPGVSWGFSAARHVASTGEVSSWDRKLKSFHEIGNFGSLTFSESPLALEIAALGSMWLGPNTAQIVASNFSSQSATAKINVRVMGRDKHGHFFGATKVTIPPSSRQSQTIPYSVYQDGFSTVAFSLTDASGKTVWRSSPYGVVTPEVAPQIAAVERALGAATKAWMSLPDSDNKKALQGDLDALTVQWRALVTQYRDRQKLERSELEELAEFALRLKGEAEMLQKQIQTAKTAERPGAKFTLAAAPSDVHVFPEDLGFEPATSARVDMCRNETESLQVVVLPFR
ncbi:MAG: sugar-binding protein [Armatimonadia bacterium]